MQTKQRYDSAARAVNLYSTDLVRFAWSILGVREDAQDAVQEAFVSYLKHAPRFTDAAHEKAWLLKVTANKAKNMLRHRKTAVTEELREDIPAPREDGEILRAILQMPEKYRTPVHLFYYEGYSIREIAHILGLREATVGTHLARGREILREYLGGDQI